MDLSWIFGEPSGEGEEVSSQSSGGGSVDLEGSVGCGVDVLNPEEEVVDRNRPSDGSGVSASADALSVNELQHEFEEVLVRLGNPAHSVENDVMISQKLFNIRSTAAVHRFLHFCCNGLNNCLNAGKKSHQLNSFVIIERKFKDFRLASENSEAWYSVLNACGVERNDASSCCLQHILQHFWTTNSAMTPEMPAIPPPRMTISESQEDELENAGILHHGGWCIKRARDDTRDLPAIVQLRVRLGSEEKIEVQKVQIENMVGTIGQDVPCGNEGYKFVVNEHFIQFFKALHDKASVFIKYGIEQHLKDTVNQCFDEMAKDKDIRALWSSALGLEKCSDLTVMGASVIILKSTVFFFLKSKQNSMCKKINVAPVKKSVALRQALKASGSKDVNKRKLCEKDGLITKIRNSYTESEKLRRVLVELGQHEQIEEICMELSGKELTKLLKALGKPSYSGK